MANESFGNKPIQNGSVIIPNALYFYLIDSEIIGSNVDEQKMIVPPVSAVQSVVYAPYMDASDFECETYDFDAKRFPLEETQETYGKNCKVKRIYKITNGKQFKTLGTFKPYEIVGKDTGIGKPRSWKNEGKLWQYPYQYPMIYDGISSPIEIKPHLCQDKETATIKAKVPLTNTGQYSLYVEGYKEDTGGYFEGSTSTSSLMIPLASSAYTDYMSQNKNQLAQQRNQNIGKLVIGGLMVGAAAAALAPATGGTSLVAYGSMAAAKASVATTTAVATGAKAIGTGMAISGGAGFANSMLGQMATERDLQNTPGTLSGLGNDTLHDLQSLGSRNSLNVYRMTCQPEYLQRVGDYLAMFGYKQNRIFTPNLRNRHYYNYIKTEGVNITCKDGVGIPKEHFNLIKQIYNSGTTIWHITREGVNVGDYRYDNVEV